VPTFLLGLVAVAGVCAALPFQKETALSELDRNIATIRQTLKHPHAPVEPILILAQSVLSHTNQDLGQPGEAHFLLGSVYLRLSDQSSPGRARRLREQALLELEQAEKLGVAPQDQANLNYRLGKAWFLKGGSPDRVVACLARAIAEAEDDQAEGYRMLAQAYMSLPAPNLEGALTANMKLFALPIDDEKILGPARLMCGEILFQQKKPREALKMLGTIAQDAPASLLARAHYLQGRCCQDLRLYAQAISFWLEVLKESADPPGGRPQIWYYLGFCYHNDEPPRESEAANAWGKVWKDESDNGQAAALGLADLYLSPAQPNGRPINTIGALEAFRQALARVTGPKDYYNPLVDLKKARKLIERGCEVYRSGHDFERALQLVELYKKIALPGVALELEGQTAEDWAKEIKDQPVPTGTSEAAQQEKYQALFLRAGSAWQEVAAARSEAEQPGVLWHSAQCYLLGKHYGEATTVLDRYLQMKIPQQHRGEAWYKLAEARLALAKQKPDQEAVLRKAAWDALDQAILLPGPFAFQARYQMALAEIQHQSGDAQNAENHWDRAESLLQDNLDPPNGVPAPPSIHEKSLFQLAGLLYKRHKWDRAAIYLQNAVDRYPSNLYILQAREKLAECYARMADQYDDEVRDPDNYNPTPETKTYKLKQKGRYAELAMNIYEKLEEDLEPRRKAGTLDEIQQGILRRASFAAVNFRFDLGYYPEALRRAQNLAERYADQVDSLCAYQNIFRCCVVLQKTEDARTALKKATATLNGPLKTVPDDTFRAATGTNMNRQEWETWIRERDRQLPRETEKR
jgi:tetratricopeptide (TPR) repeat protein